MTREILERDPFGVTADPAAYIPRLATERALAALERGIEEGAGPILLCGPAGLGKTLLLHVLAQRLEPRLRTVVLSYAALPPAELCLWALELLGEPPSDDPEAALVAHASRLQARGSGLLLLLDDAGSMPPPTARRMAELAAGSQGALRLVGAAVDDARSGRVLAALGPEAHEIRLSTGMDPRETALYVRARLERMGASEEARRRFDTETLERISRSSGGVPRVVQQLASEVLWRRGDARARPAWALSTEPLDSGEEAMEEPEDELSPRDARLASLMDRREAGAEGEGAIWRALTGAVAARNAPAPPAAPPRIEPPAAPAPPAPTAQGATPKSVGPEATTARPVEPVAALAAAPEARPAARREPAPPAEPPPPVASPRSEGEAASRVPGPPQVAPSAPGSAASPSPTSAAPARGARPAVPARAEGGRARASAGPVRRPQAATARVRRALYVGLALATLLLGALLLLRMLPPPGATPASDGHRTAPPPPAEARAPGAPSAEEPPTPKRVEEPPPPAAQTPAASAGPVPAEAPAAPAPEPPAAAEPVAPAEPAAAPVAEPTPAAPAPAAAAPEPQAEPAAAAAAPAAEPAPAVAPPPAPSPAEAPAPPPVAAQAPPAAAVVPTIPVDVNATPWATIEIDGKSLGETPLAGVPLVPGTHRFRATFPGGRVVERDVRIDARRRRVVLP